MDGLSSAVNIISIIDTSIKVIAWCYEYVEEFKAYEEERRRLLQAVTNLKLVSTKVKELLKGPQGARLKASKELQDTTYDGKIRLKNVDAQLRKNGKSSRIIWPFKKKGLEEDIQVLGGCTQVIIHILQIDVAVILLDVDLRAKLAQHRTAIESLAFAEGAPFDSQAEQHNPSCLKSTRVEILGQINAWIDNADSKTIFWLNGMAGTGKSTISRTVAASVQSKGKLGASFFFKRETDRVGLARFFTTIARQLATTQPTFASNLIEIVDNDRGVITKAAHVQFKRLILDPLSASAQDLVNGTTLVIVIDALDECEKEEDIKLLIRLLSQAAAIRGLSLRILVTSRPELPVRLGFSTVQGTYQDCILHQIPQNIIRRDIFIYLHYELAKIRINWNASVEEHRQLSSTWPKPVHIGSLTTKAMPLFIVAATMCRFISDRNLGDPDRQLRRLLKSKGGTDTSKMGIVYSPVLDQLVADATQRDREAIIRGFLRVVGTIVCLASPLSATSLSSLLGIDREEVDTRLDNLHSVLSIPKSPERALRMLHLSFRDYLLDPSTRSQNPFWVDEKVQARFLTKVCLRVMKLHLKIDICGLRSPGTRRVDIPGNQVNACLPPELQYACLYWSHHLKVAGVREKDVASLYDFLKKNILHWMEAMALMDRAWQISGSLKIVQSLLGSNSNEPLSGFITDAMRYLHTNISTISSVPLQIYCGLVFAPENSIVRGTSENQIPKWISIWPSVEPDWNSCLQILEGHKEQVTAVAFTPDSRLLISASDDKTIRVWNWDTGECIHDFKDHQHPVCSAIMSPDAEVVASGASNGTIRIWSLTTGASLHVLEGGAGDMISSLAFSPDSKRIYSISSDMAIRTWNRDTGVCVDKAPSQFEAVGKPVVSPDLKIRAFWSRDGWIEVHDSSEEKFAKKRLDYRKNRIQEVIFSANSKFMAMRAGNSNFQIWSQEYRKSSDKCLLNVTGHTKKIKTLVFSPDSSVIASGSEDDSVRVWSVATGDCLAHSFGFGDGVEKLLFSPDSRFLAAALLDSTMVTWNWAADDSVVILQGHSGLVTSMLFSPDSTVLASFSLDQTIRVWDWKKGADESSLHHDFGKVISLRVSPDKSMVATISADKKLRIWCTTTGVCLKELDWGRYLSREYLSLGSPIPFFSPDSTMVGLSPACQTAPVWNIKTGKRVLSVDACHPRESVCLFYSPDFQKIAAVPQAKDSFDIWHYNNAEFEHQRSLSTAGLEASQIIFTQKLLIASLHDPNSSVGVIWAWDLATGKTAWKKLAEYYKLRGKGPPMALSHDGSILAAVLLQGPMYMRVWKTDTGKQLGEVALSGDMCTELTFSSDRHFVALMKPHSVDIWEWKIGRCAYEVSNVPVGSRDLRIFGQDEGIETNLGSSFLPPETWRTGNRTMQPSFHSELAFNTKTCWVQYRGKDLLRLPAECRDSCQEISGFVLAVGCQTGRVLIIKFDKSELAKSVGTLQQKHKGFIRTKTNKMPLNPSQTCQWPDIEGD